MLDAVKPLPYRLTMSGVKRQKNSRRGGGEVTIAEVAREAHVSPMTVSRVLNGGQNVRPETKELVDAAIAKLHYVPNVAARALAGGRNCRIALLYSNPSAAYLSAFMMGALEACARLDAQLVVEPFTNGMSFPDMVAHLAVRRIDAVLLPAPLCDSEPLMQALRDARLPVAQIASGRSRADCFAVSIDDHAASVAMTKYLIDRGHTRIGFIGGSADQSASGIRQQGYLDALTAAGLAFDPALVETGDFTYRSGLAAGEALLSLPDRPTAIFASNDDMAAAVVAVAHRMGLSVPAEVAVCGFDDTIMATSVWPELTTIRQPVPHMAMVAVEAMFRAVDEQRRGSESVNAQVQLNYQLIARGSA